jgi:AcrR family transcriptional regulator
MLKKTERNEMAEHLVEAALKLIEERGGLHGVNLRQIAKEAGCAHTNVYNYYQDFEALLWDVFDRIGEVWMDYRAQHLQPGLAQDELVRQLFSVQIDFALKHPGWYRCLWSEPLSGKPPKEIVDNRRKQRDAMARLLIEMQPNTLSKEQADNLFVILFNYVHGAISLLINGRVYRSDLQSYKLQTLDNVQMLVRVLKDQDDFQSA